MKWESRTSTWPHLTPNLFFTPYLPNNQIPKISQMWRKRCKKCIFWLKNIFWFKNEKKRLEFVFTKHPRTSLINFINPKQFRKGWESRARTSDYINGLHLKFGNFCNFSCLGCLWRPVRCQTVLFCRRLIRYVDEIVRRV